MSYFQDDDASQIRQLKEKQADLQAQLLAQYSSVQLENVESGQSTIPSANPSARGGGTGSGLSYPIRPDTNPDVTTIDLTNGADSHFFKKTLTLATTTFTIINPPPAGKWQDFIIELTQDVIGGRLVDFTTNQTIEGGAEPTIRSGINEVTRLYVMVKDGVATYKIYSDADGGGSGDNLGNHIATQDIDYATFDGKNIDRLLLDQAAGNSLLSTQTGITSNVAGEMLFNTNGLLAKYNFGMNADGSPRLQINNTSVVSQSIFPVDSTPVSGDELGSNGNEWARLSVTDIVLKTGNDVSKIIFDGDASTPKTYFTASATVGRVNFYSPIGGVATNIAAFTNSSIDLFGNTDLTLTTGQIRAGGIQKGMENIGELTFVNNTATPAVNGVLYFDGTDLKAKTGGGVVNLSDIISSSLTANRAIISDVSGDLVASAITSAELLNALTGYITGPSVETRLSGLESSSFDPLNIDSDLIADITSIRNIGSTGKFWASIFANRYYVGDTSHFLEKNVSDLRYETPAATRHNFTIAGVQEAFIDSTGLTITNDLTVRDDTVLGETSAHTLNVNAKIISDLKIDDGFVIKPNVGKIAFYTNRTGTIGTEGSIGIPTFDGFEDNTNAQCDSLFGNHLGAQGIFTRGGSGGTPLLVCKIDVSPSQWKGVLLNNYTPT